MMLECESVFDHQFILGEGPVWHGSEGRLYWVDIMKHCICRFLAEQNGFESIDMGLPVGCVAIRSSGGVVIALRDGIASWDDQNRGLDYLVKIRPETPLSRFNDGKVDPAGRFWAGTMGSQEGHHLYRLDVDHNLNVMEDGITISNGIGWSPDMTRMYYTDTPTRRIDVYDYDLNSGAIWNRRGFAELAVGDGVPDGLTVDSEGFVWSACWGGGKVIRYSPEGKVDLEIKLPAEFPSSCTFGGENLDILYITSASEPLTAEQRKARPMDGRLFKVSTPYKGVPANLFMG